jgi:NTP pyrophosphatase (non-canonical NTP hydrolase)
MNLTPEQERAVQAVIVCGGPLPSRETYAKARALRDRFAAENAAPAPPLSDARVERAARELRDWGGADMGPSEWRELARAVLTAADAVPTTNPAPVSSSLVVRDFPDGLVRESVAWFAEQMERKLRLHDDRPGWMGNLPNALLDRVREEVDELDNALDYGARAEDQSHPQNIIDECADVANMAMMIADNMRDYLPPEPIPAPPGGEGEK